MDTAQLEKLGKIVRMMIFAAVAIIIIGPIVLWIALEPVLGPVLFPPQWKQDFEQGSEQFNSNREAAEALINKAFGEADKAPVAAKIKMHREYADLLDAASDPEAAEEQYKQAIAVMPNDPKPNSDEARELIEAHQSRALAQHQIYVEDPGETPGVKDQEQAVAIAEKALGATSKETVLALANLGLIYADMNMFEKSDATFDRAIKAAASGEAKPIAWSVYAKQARAKAYERNYPQATQAYLQAIHASPDEQADALSDLTEGLRLSVKDEGDKSNVGELFEGRNYKALDALADKLRKSQETTPEGYWKLDDFYDDLRDEYRSAGKEQLNKSIDLFKDWLKDNPHSAAARVGLAECYLFDIWQNLAAGSEDQTEEQARQFTARVADAHRILDGDPEIKRRDPRTFEVYANIAEDEQFDKSASRTDEDQEKNYRKLLYECRQMWPSYKTIEVRVCSFMPSSWYETDGNWSEFAKECADNIGGITGDKLYAQCAYESKDFFHNMFTEDPKADWPRTKSGCNQIIAQFPHDLGARLMLIDLASIKGDDNMVKNAIVGFQK